MDSYFLIHSGVSNAICVRVALLCGIRVIYWMLRIMYPWELWHVPEMIRVGNLAFGPGHADDDVT